MCGITGSIFLDKGRSIDISVLKKMTTSLYHRGPDDEGFFIHRNVGLGFRRLSIIDLETGHQPLIDTSETLIIVFNGEIYNYLEQREILKKKSHTFRTTSDTEVILELYKEYGVDCLKHLRGMFAFAIWDKTNEQLFCARDRFGIKPFYYYSDNEKFVFGSEIKAILEAEDIDRTISFAALDSYFAFGYITSDLSIYHKIKKLQPGHYLLLSFKEQVKLEIKKYWEILFDPDYSKTENQWKEEIEACLMETVKLHMISDVPLGAFLSGGIDSSSVVAMMAKNSNVPVKTFSIGFKEQTFNELEYSREMANKYNCEYHEQIIEPESIGLLPKLVSAYDEPFADSSAIPTYYVSKHARENVTVALSGDGGDELFAGYDIYPYFNKIHTFPLNHRSPHFSKHLWRQLYRLLPKDGRIKNATYFLSQNKDFLNAYLNIWSTGDREQLFLVDSGSKKQIGISESFKEEMMKESGSNDFVTNMQLLDLKTYMVDDILTKVDRASMMNSLEVRVPLLDHKFAELSFKIPWDLKLKHREQKYILKQAMATSLSENILNHAKQGFSIPFSVWFKDDLKEFTYDTLLSQDPLFSTYLDKKYVRKIVEGKNTKTRNQSDRIWSLLFFEEWLKQTI